MTPCARLAGPCIRNFFPFWDSGMFDFFKVLRLGCLTLVSLEWLGSLSAEEFRLDFVVYGLPIHYFSVYVDADIYPHILRIEPFVNVSFDAQTAKNPGQAQILQFNPIKYTTPMKRFQGQMTSPIKQAATHSNETSTVKLSPASHNEQSQNSRCGAVGDLTIRRREVARGTAQRSRCCRFPGGLSGP